MCDIYLTTSPPYDPYSPPPGLGYIATYLKAKGYKPYVHDLNRSLFESAAVEDKYLWLFEFSHHWNDPYRFPDLYSKFADHIEDFVRDVISKAPAVCGFSVAYTKELFTIELIKRLKSHMPDLKIVLGGPGGSCEGSRKIYVKCVPDLIDAFVVGEGEETMVDVMAAVKDQRALTYIPGVLTYTQGRINHFTPRPLIENLDRIPFPTYEEFNLAGGLQMVVPVFSRGCIGNCVFCNVRSIWGKYRCRTPQNIFAEFKYFVETRGLTKFQMYDSAINININDLAAICDLIISAGYELDWTALAIPRRNMPLQLFEKMKKAGCNRLEIGIESGSDKILAKMRKMCTAADAEGFIRNAHRAGITVVIFLIVGFPGEGNEEFEETVNFLKRNKDCIDVISSINTFMVLEGTPIMQDADKYGIIFPDERWDLCWYTEDGNDYGHRKKRVADLEAVAKDLGIFFIKDNLID